MVNSDQSLQWSDLANDVIVVDGDDAAQFLHSQLASDILNAPIGSSVHSLLLEPTGHVVSLLRIVRQSDTRFLIDVEHGAGVTVIRRLSKFLLRAKVTMSVSDLSVRAFRGTGARNIVSAEIDHDAVLVADPWWTDNNAVDLIGLSHEFPHTGVCVDPTVIDHFRVDAGWPRMGVDIREGDIPATTNILSLAVSFTKGCYPGQELVERMDSRGTTAPVVLRVFPVSERESIDGEVTSIGARYVLARVSRQHVGGSDLSSVWM